MAGMAPVLQPCDASGHNGRGREGLTALRGVNDGNPRRCWPRKRKRIDTAMELLIIVALFALSVALGAAGTRAILGIMFSVMMRARSAHDYAGSFDRRATARAA